MPQEAGKITLRRLVSGDPAVPALEHLDLLDDPDAFFVAAFDGAQPVGFVLAHVLPRRHRDRRHLLVYEVDVDEAYRRRGIATALLDHIRALARERGIREAWVLTEPDNGPANALYESVGGTRSEVVMWDFVYEDN